MRFQNRVLFVACFCLAGVAALAQQQANTQTSGGSPPVIRTETRLVLVDAVVTDKKGNYVHDLTMKNFRVWEDNKEQSIKTFSFEADPASPSSSQKHYLVLFFDNSTMNPTDQIRAREAAAKFIDTNTGPGRLMAIVNFGGSLQIAQNFTTDADRLKQVVNGVKFSAVSPNEPVEVASTGIPHLGSAAAEFGARSVLLALRSLSKNLLSVPGRKLLVMFTAGFPLTTEVRSELTAAIDMCNRSNVAVYPIDVRGLVADGIPGLQGLPRVPRAANDLPSSAQPARFLPAIFGGGSVLYRPASFTTSFVPEQRGGAGGGTGGGTGGTPPGGRPGTPGSGGTPPGGRPGTPGGTTTPGRGTSTGTPNTPGGRGGTNVPNPNAGRGGNFPGQTQNQLNRNNPFNQPRQIVPPFPPSSSANQQVLYMLAEGTGGFVIINTNDLLGGLQKIGREQNEYYILGYTPPESAEGSCHTLRVKVDHGAAIRARSGYCNARPVDLLAGNPIEKVLENRVTSSGSGNISASMEAPYFYTSPNTARVDVSIEIPSESIKFEKVKGKLHSAVNVLGIAYRPDGAVGARFSDTVKVDLENKKELGTFTEQPLHYENQFDVAAGQYTLKIVFSSGGESFGKLEKPLAIDSYDGQQFSVSQMALSKDFHKVSEMESNLDSQLLEGRAPLVAQGFQFTPSGTYRFKKTEPAAIYVEIYEPLLLGASPPKVQVQIRLVDRKTGQQSGASGIVDVANFIRPGNAVIPVGLKLPVGELGPGSYKVELQAADSAGKSMIRSADFEVE